ncbi:dihydrolipoyl dehydrogenase [Lignipirellula cremea]|uniref:Dihydrolipoyl dehydrogenase n=1 Tax=Lignipirellula cremea TaxID=2528010 RepID=A0A518DNT4_9BACT|nr:dihydrolipoyl dehydrogenase [Lignipirellula cremea]QDU93499.1 Dihydrolipoyl dehydrogenase [Lignipirellula cremea]
MHTQLAVLGGGPGGYAAAFLAADEGMEVTLVELEDKLGGTCLLRGCIPSKALLHVARVIAEAEELRGDWGIEFGQPQIDREKLLERKNRVITELSGGLAQLAKKRKVRVITARGVFENSTTLRLEGDHDSIPEGGKLTFDHCILATGSVPAMPPAFNIGSDRVLDSTGALNLPSISPETKLLVIGGGYIGLELGSVYAQLGAQVSVVELLEGLLMGADRDLVRPLHRRLEKLFDKRIFLNTKVGSLTDQGDGVQVVFEGPNKFGTEKYDYVLVSVGRRPNTRNLGLENTQVEVDDRGFVVCDKKQRTGDPHIFAIGDIAGDPMLAHKATHEGRIAAEVILGRPAEFDKRAIPAVVFTDPEIAWAGYTEDEARKAGVTVEVVAYPWAASGRARALGRVEGLTKWLVDPDTSRVIGCGMVGPGAGELISEAVLAIEMGCEVRDITETIHPHPTLSETVMNAAEVYFGTATEIYKPKS